ncbi:formyltetrahydrofolate deformylase [Sphingomonas desiccabilis]|uniref:Formyltetrahydrofolate deformylase n=1 Tax=Sphingomonas desiccabilis TaxID=429134 RepID=A0A4Q2IPB9_9SPHN|nr:formyltetrahydrofolate deformylase [Sphingomonas desiccabilis]MBB3911822.1 formyltetrahydrofolate deformylase [Sphingomonas desiccabilis]RXZ31463.1 formyltetrahydrofolate deformylase [Sphingomonas desiccabilis]
MTIQRAVARITCRNAPGIVACVARSLAAAGFDIRDSQQFEDVESDRFFMRVDFQGEARSRDEIARTLAECVDRFDMTIDLALRDRPKRVLLLASRTDHCLIDLIHRWRDGELVMEPIAIVSNHPHPGGSGGMLHGLPFHHLPVTPATRDAQEEAILHIAEAEGADLVVLARYMQILSDRMAAALAGRCINIHHSFLPGFKGARPYHQAHARGVKMIGATAHYVTADLDEGPIIAQDVTPITHADDPAELIRKGRDIERRVLARALRLDLEGRVLVNGSRTVIFQS